MKLINCERKGNFDDMCWSNSYDVSLLYGLWGSDQIHYFKLLFWSPCLVAKTQWYKRRISPGLIYRSTSLLRMLRFDAYTSIYTLTDGCKLYPLDKQGAGIKSSD